MKSKRKLKSEIIYFFYKDRSMRRTCYKRIYMENPLSYIPLHKKPGEKEENITGYYLYILKCNRFSCCCWCLPPCFRDIFYIFQEPIYN